MNATASGASGPGGGGLQGGLAGAVGQFEGGGAGSSAGLPGFNITSVQTATATVGSVVITPIATPAAGSSTPTNR